MNPSSGSAAPFVIAEAGVNHNGDLALARRLIEVAHECGADAVKFQTWKDGEIIGRFATKVSYLEERTAEAESFHDLGARLCLPYPAFVELQAHCAKVGIEFLTTPDGFESLEFVAHTLRVRLLKVGSTELNHPQYLRAIGSKRLPVILSTGLGTLAEVEAALAALRAGGGDDLPITVLHCTSQYPAPDAEVNLRAMVTMAQAFGVPVGLSDHSLGAQASIAAVALGACVLEKHFTLDCGMDGPDHAASLDPAGLAAYVSSVRRTATMLGDGRKAPTASERINMDGIRRSVVAARALPAGTVLGAADLACKRPGTGVAPPDMPRLVGLTLKSAKQADEPIAWTDLR